MPVMPNKPSIKTVEAQLGFNFKSGLSVDQRVKERVETLDLFKGINHIKETHKTIVRSEIYSSEDVKRDAEELFMKLGPKLWPDWIKNNRHPPPWLFYPGHPMPEESPLHRLYPRSLFFSNQEDRTVLSQHFYDMICWKILRYTERQRNTLSPATSNYSTTYFRKSKGHNVDSLWNAMGYAGSNDGVDDEDIIYDDDEEDDPEGSYQPDSRSSDRSSLSATPRPTSSTRGRIIATASSQKACAMPGVPAKRYSNPLPSTSFEADRNQRPGDKRAAVDDSGDEASQGGKRKHRQTVRCDPIKSDACTKTDKDLEITPSSFSVTGMKNAQQKSFTHRGWTVASNHRSSSQDPRMTPLSAATVLATACGASSSQDSGVTPRSAARAFTTANHAERAVSITKAQDGPQTQSTGAQIKVASRPGESRTNPSPRVNDEANQPRTLLRTPDVPQQKVLGEQTHRPTIAIPVTATAADRGGSRNDGVIDKNKTAARSANGSDHDLTSGAVNDQDSHPIHELVQPPEADRRDHASEDAAASASKTASDAAPVEDTIVVQHSTQARSAVMDTPLNTQKEVSSEPGKSQNTPGWEDDATIIQPRLVLRGSGLPETDTRKTTVPRSPTRSIGNAADESGLQIVVNKHETTTSPTDMNSNALMGIFFSLYLDEETDPLEPQCCVKLTGLTTRDELFKMMDEDLQDDLDAGDRIVTVKVKRADGEVFRGPNVRTMPIKRVGQQDMWRELISTLLEHGAGQEGLRGYVKVKKCVGDPRHKLS